MTSQLSRFTLVVPIAAAAILAACSSSTSSNNPKPAADVAIVSGAATKAAQAFNPDTFTVFISGGGKVKWRNDDGIPHTATADQPSDSTAGFYTGHLAGGDTLTLNFSGFSANDTVHYHCSIHPGMVGVVIVKP